jgi:DNA polymerase delta subunit 1
MSPTKRSVSCDGEGGWRWEEDDLLKTIRCKDEEHYGGGGVPTKRLRGGGGGDDDDVGLPFEDDGVFEDPMNIAVEQEEEQYIPLEAMEEAARVAASLSDRQRWERPAVGAVDGSDNKLQEHDLDFQWLDMDVVSGPALSSNPNPSRKSVVGQTGAGRVPILRTYGVTQHGNSVCAFIHGFTPYAYFAVPPGYEVDESELGAMRSELTDRLQGAVRQGGSNKESIKVVGIVLVEDHKSIFGYETPYNTFLKIYVSLPNLIPTLRRIMEDGINLSGIEAASSSSPAGGMMPQFAPFEANVPFVLRFMVDRDIAGAGWLTLPGKTYQIRPIANKETHCQVHT